MDDWRTERLLILGNTYPAYSSKYRELACTGAIVERTRSLVRIHPMPKRYLDESRQFSAWQWISARVKRLGDDPRPDSLRIDVATIALEAKMENKEERRNWVTTCTGFCQSVEAARADVALQGVHAARSLVVIRPKAIVRVWLERRTEQARIEWLERERSILHQGALFGETKPIDFPEMRFMVEFECDDVGCAGHSMGLQTWGLHELYRKYRNDTDKVLAAMRDRLDMGSKEVFFFIGTRIDHQTNFMLLDSLDVKRGSQMTLFGSVL